MSSLRRISASRRNGARSPGPKTEAGKSRSSANAIRHGLLAQRVVLENESEPNFQSLLGQYLDKFAPRDGVEFGMIEEMVASYWRLHRTLAIERYLFSQALATHPEGDELSRLGQSWCELADFPRLLNLLRYQTMLHRMHQRALNNLLLLRDIQPDDAELPKEPSPNSGHSAALPPAGQPGAGAAVPGPAADRLDAAPGVQPSGADRRVAQSRDRISGVRAPGLLVVIQQDLKKRQRQRPCSHPNSAIR